MFLSSSFVNKSIKKVLPLVAVVIVVPAVVTNFIIIGHSSAQPVFFVIIKFITCQKKIITLMIIRWSSDLVAVIIGGAFAKDFFNQN